MHRDLILVNYMEKQIDDLNFVKRDVEESPQHEILKIKYQEFKRI